MMDSLGKVFGIGIGLTIILAVMIYIGANPQERYEDVKNNHLAERAVAIEQQEEQAIQIDLPQRASDALSGTEVLAQSDQMSIPEREDFFLAQLEAGNMPRFLAKLYPVVLEQSAIKATFYAMPDYLAIGSDADYFRVPLSWFGAKKVAQVLRLNIPTPKMVDAIYQSAEVKLDPVPLPPQEGMRSNGYIRDHRSKVTEKLGLNHHGIIAGHKKDLVRTCRLNESGETKVAIYGWHRLRTGRPIQPLSLVHSADYMDYSHGLRLVDDLVNINGTLMSLDEVLNHPEYSKLFTNETGHFQSIHPTPLRPASGNNRLPSRS